MASSRPPFWPSAVEDLCLLAGCLLLACAPAPEKPSPLTVLAQASSGPVSAELLSASPLTAGQNRVFYRLTKEGVAFPGARVEQRPLLREERAPVQDPGGPNADGLWEGLVIFTRPSSEWTLSLDVENAGERDRLEFGALNVAESPRATVVMRDGRPLVISVAFSEPPHVGTNEVVISAHQASAAGSDYAAVGDLSFSVSAQMARMGHGGPANQPPSRGEEGLYRGTVVLSLAGDWVIEVVVVANDAQLGALEFPIGL
jgi:hypothetical protein